ncbi:MAG: hypothetical protein WC729_28970 [Sphingomonas sp.]|uniref:hypothetical protein n=1 Tax=Sphingomonas sp. TaxID=28214 RepID=UPI0035693B4A
MRQAGWAIAVALGCAAPVMAQDAAPAVVTGDATAGLVSKQAIGEVHVVADPALANGRLVLRIVVLNRGKAPVEFGPASVSVASRDGVAVPLVPRNALLDEQGGVAPGTVTEDTSQSHAGAAMLVTPNGQTDVSGFTGGSGTTYGGVPQSTMDRSQRRTDPKTAAAVAALDAVLLKPMTLKPGAADGGQVVTTRLKRGKIVSLIVSIAFAGETHRFDVAVPKR